MSRVLIAIAVMAAACTAAPVEASGNLVGEARNTGGFSRIDAADGVSVRLVVDPSAPAAVVVHYDDNLIDAVSTVVSDDTLRIRLDASVSMGGEGERFVAVSVPAIDGVDLSAGADLTGSGMVTALHVTATGGATVDLHGFLMERVTIDARGGADVTVTATESVTGEAIGGATVTVLGDPATVDVTTSGGATVVHR